MLYRIRYRDAGACDEMETTVEANGPSEAVVKFESISAPPNWRTGVKTRVTSVFAAEAN